MKIVEIGPMELIIAAFDEPIRLIPTASMMTGSTVEMIAIQPDRVTRPTIGPVPKGAKPPRPPKPRG